MKPYTSNGLVWWDETEIETREGIIRCLIGDVRRTLQGINPAIVLHQVETPCLMPPQWAENPHLPYYSVGAYCLRAESTRGTYWIQEHVQHRLPVCVFQVNKSFREETTDAIRLSKLRLREFWQLEFQLFYAPSTKADYHHEFVANFPLERWQFQIKELSPAELPPYATKTTDFMLQAVEVASLSTRQDFTTPVFEISFGLDRLTALWHTGRLPTC